MVKDSMSRARAAFELLEVARGGGLRVRRSRPFSLECVRLSSVTSIA